MSSIFQRIYWKRKRFSQEPTSIFRTKEKDLSLWHKTDISGCFKNSKG